MLERFGVEPPRYIKSFEPRLSDVQYREVPGISEELSLRRAWDYMNENDIQTLAVVDEDRHLKGLLTCLPWQIRCRRSCRMWPKLPEQKLSEPDGAIFQIR